MLRTTAGNVLIELGQNQETKDASLQDRTQHLGALGKGRQRWGTQTGAQTNSDGPGLRALSTRASHPAVKTSSPRLNCTSAGSQVTGQELGRPHQHPELLSQNQQTAGDSGARNLPEEQPRTPGCALTAVPMGGVRAQADIAGDEQLWEGGADLLDCLDGRCVLRISSGASLILWEEKCLSQGPRPRPRASHQ